MKNRTVVLDTGALLAGDRNDSALLAIVKATRDKGSLLLVPAGCVAEAWRNGRTQANLARLLKSINGFPELDLRAATRVGELLARTTTAQPIDASVVEVAIRSAPSVIVTSDQGDMQALLVGTSHDVAVYAIGQRVIDGLTGNMGA